MRKRAESAGFGGAPPRAHDPQRGERGHIGYLLRQAQVAVRQAIESSLAGLPLTLPQFSVMTVLGAHASLSGAELARLTLLTPQTINLIVRNLERRGLLLRTPHPTHGRILAMALTRSGRRLLSAAKPRVAAIERQMTEGLAAADERAVRAWLIAVARRMMRRRPASFTVS